MNEAIYIAIALSFGWFAAPTMAMWHTGSVNVGPPREPDREVVVQTRVHSLARVYRGIFAAVWVLAFIAPAPWSRLELAYATTWLLALITAVRSFPLTIRMLQSRDWSSPIQRARFGLLLGFPLLVALMTLAAGGPALSGEATPAPADLAVPSVLLAAGAALVFVMRRYLLELEQRRLTSASS